MKRKVGRPRKTAEDRISEREQLAYQQGYKDGMARLRALTNASLSISLLVANLSTPNYVKAAKDAKAV